MYEKVDWLEILKVAGRIRRHNGPAVSHVELKLFISNLSSTSNLFLESVYVYLCERSLKQKERGFERCLIRFQRVRLLIK